MAAVLQQYLTIDGVELINAVRTRAYVDLGLAPAWQVAESCFNFDLYPSDFGVDDFANPVTDPAPWYDANDSDSAHFFGVSVRSFVTEMPLERFNAGPRRMGRLQTKIRRFALEADLLADDCCGTDYGKRWLLAVFGAGCGVGCATLPAVVSTCPDALRDVYGVGLVSFEDVSPGDMPCCIGARVRVVFQAENPYFYGPSESVLLDGVWEGSGFSDDDCVPWDLCPEETVAPCASGITPTIAPPPLPSLAGPLAPGGVNVAWCNPTFEVSQCVTTPVSLPTFGEAVFRFTIDNSAAAVDMLYTRIRVWDGGDVVASDSDCEVDGPDAFLDVAPLAELRITFIPAGGVLVVDGASRTVQLYCPDTGEWQNADYLTYGPNSAFWQHPVIGCGITELCVCATADAENVDPLSTFTVEVIPRYL
jgi:hypothetical protein